MKNAKRLLLLILTLCMLAFTACAGEEAKNDNSGDVSADTTSAEENVTKVVEESDDIEQSDNNLEDISSAEESDVSNDTSGESEENVDEESSQDKTATTGEVEKASRFRSVIDSLSDEYESRITIWIAIDYPDDLEQYVEDKAYELTGLRPEDITDSLGIEAVQNYIRTKRAINREIHETQNEEFANTVIIPNGGTDVSCFIYSPAITFSATKSEAEVILSNPRVATVVEVYSCDSKVVIVNSPYEGEAYYAKELIGDIYRQWYFMEKAYYVKNADDEPHKGLLDDADAVYATAIEFSVNKDMELEEVKARIAEDLTELGIYVEWSYERGKYNGEERVYYAVYATQAQIEAVRSDNTNDNMYKSWLIFPLSVECTDLDAAIDYINFHDGGHKYNA